MPRQTNQPGEGRLLLQGTEMGYDWSIALDTKTGKMSVTLVNREDVVRAPWGLHALVDRSPYPFAHSRIVRSEARAYRFVAMSRAGERAPQWAARSTVMPVVAGIALSDVRKS